jgi:predicted transposase/invertase (TIGR01784 family)
LTESELVTRKDKWLYFLKNLDSFDDIPAIFREPIFEKAFKTAEYLMYPPAVKEAYQCDLKAYRDNRNALITADILGEARGEIKKQTEIAAKMKAKGYPLTDIADVTGMSIDEIKKL